MENSNFKEGSGATALDLQSPPPFLYSNLRKKAPYGREAWLRISSSDGDQLVQPPGPKLAERRWVYWDLTGSLLCVYWGFTGGLLGVWAPFLWKSCLNSSVSLIYVLEKQTPFTVRVGSVNHLLLFLSAVSPLFSDPNVPERTAIFCHYE